MRVIGLKIFNSTEPIFTGRRAIKVVLSIFRAYLYHVSRDMELREKKSS